MRADYDSEADALSIDLLIVDRWDGPDDPIDDSYCHVSFAGGEPANIEILSPRAHPEAIDFLDQAAERYGLDAEALRAIAKAALQAPDRIVEIKVGGKLTTAES